MVQRFAVKAVSAPDRGGFGCVQQNPGGAPEEAAPENGHPAKGTDRIQTRRPNPPAITHRMIASITPTIAALSAPTDSMHPEPTSSPRFRFDINGLRAWAVVAVIGYHFGLSGFGGGFVGVDVFFVISGFLMTGIVVSGLERGPPGFTLPAFYMARARRILPALIVLCAVLLLLGWWLLLPRRRTVSNDSARWNTILRSVATTDCSNWIARHPRSQCAGADSDGGECSQVSCQKCERRAPFSDESVCRLRC